MLVNGLIHDQLSDGRLVRLLNVIDGFNHEAILLSHCGEFFPAGQPDCESARATH